MSKELLCGPYGTELERYGYTPPIWEIVCTGYWRDRLLSIMKNYCSAGATIVTSPTFGLRRLLTENRGGKLYEATFLELFKMMQEVVRRESFLSANFGPQNDCYIPQIAPTTQEAKDFHGEQIGLIIENSPDILLFETVNTIREAVGIALSIKNSHSDAQGIISFVLRKDGNLLSGESFRDAVFAIHSICPHIRIGINCCAPEALPLALLQLEGAKNLRGNVMAVYPNASSHDHDHLENHEEVLGVENPWQMAKFLWVLSKRFNVEIIGGCCGFSPKDYAVMSQFLIR